jgi:predicted dehydrogenase
VNTRLKILQIGAGSMGKRRLRDLHEREDVELALYDQREDRRDAARARFGVKTFAGLEDALAWEPDALIISTPPGTKKRYIDLALERGFHHFSEADIWTYGAARRTSDIQGLVMWPSASLNHLPVVRALHSVVANDLGSLLSYHHALGTYMPGWHTDEGNEYYGRHRSTAPAREMVCFELHFLNAVFGAPTEVAGYFGKFGELSGESEDTWSLLLRLQDRGTGHLTSTMACPSDYRRGCCFGIHGFATWDIQSGEITVSTESDPKVRTLQFGAVAAVLERSYFEEIHSFVDAVLSGEPAQQTYSLNQKSTATLAAAEKSSVSGQWIEVDADDEPEMDPPLREAAGIYGRSPGMPK